MKLFCLLALAALSCGGSSHRGGATTPADRAEHGPGAGGGAGRAGGGEEPGDQPLTKEECARFFDHVIDVEVERWRGEKPAEEMPTPEQIHKIRQRMKDEEMERCLAQPRADWQCAMAAETQAEVAACVPAE